MTYVGFETYNMYLVYILLSLYISLLSDRLLQSFTTLNTTTQGFQKKKLEYIGPDPLPFRKFDLYGSSMSCCRCFSGVFGRRRLVY